MQTVTISGGFHGTPEFSMRLADGRMSSQQYRRLARRLCGISGCQCDIRTATAEGMPFEDFWREVEEAEHRAWIGQK